MSQVAALCRRLERVEIQLQLKAAERKVTENGSRVWLLVKDSRVNITSRAGVQNIGLRVADLGNRRGKQKN